MDANEAMSSIGNPWRKPWQMIMYFLIRTSSEVISSWQMLAIVFIGAEPKHRCRLPDSVWPNMSIPYRDVAGERIYDSCVVYENFSSDTNRTIPCPMGWEYEHDSFTITQQWNLVCDANYGAEATQVFLVMGVVVGALTMMPVSDIIGRKRTYLNSACASCLVLFLTAWTTNYYVFVALRFLLGIFLQGSIVPAYVLSCELFPTKHRAIAGVILMQIWSFSIVLLAIIAYFIRDWRHLLMITSLPGLLNIPLFWIIPESVPWLIAKNRLEEAKTILETAARWNGIDLPQKFRLNSNVAAKYVKGEEMEPLQHYPSEANSETTPVNSAVKYTMMDIFRSPTLLRHLLVLYYLWFVMCLVYYGLSLTSGTLAGNMYINVALSGAIEIPAFFMCAFVLRSRGRRWTLFVFFTTAGISLLVTLVLEQTSASGTEHATLILVLKMVGKFGITASYGGIYLYTTELFPTTIRNMGFGLAAAGGQMGNILAPISTYFIRIVPWLPGLVFGTMALGAASLVLVLPETHGRNLPQSIEEIENWNRRSTQDTLMEKDENIATEVCKSEHNV